MIKVFILAKETHSIYAHIGNCIVLSSDGKNLERTQTIFYNKEGLIGINPKNGIKIEYQNGKTK